MASGGVCSESLKCQTLVLKVSIHCEGCRKKVHKILKGIPGVYDIEIDARLNRVTVKSIVDAETLVRRLEKSGKHAELWPEIKQSKHVPAPANGGNAGNKNEKESKEKPKTKDPQPPPEKYDKKKPAVQAAAKADAKTKSQAEPPSKTHNKNEETAEKQPKLDSGSKKTDDTATQGAAAAGSVAAVPVDRGSEKEAGYNGSGKKKGKKKVQKEISDEMSQRNLDAATTNSPSPPQPLQRQHQQQEHMYSSYPPHYPPPPPSAYVMSYNMAQPSVSQAYYAPPPPASHGYMYTPYPPPPEYYGGPPVFGGAPTSWIPQPPLHDNVFSDENPNSCSLM